MEQLSTLYHGSDTTVNSPSLDRGKPNNDLIFQKSSILF